MARSSALFLLVATLFVALCQSQITTVSSLDAFSADDVQASSIVLGAAVIHGDTPVNRITSLTAVTCANIFTCNRDLFLELTSAPAAGRSYFAVSAIPGSTTEGELTINNEETVVAQYSIQYDGADASSSINTGNAPVDITAGGATAIQFFTLGNVIAPFVVEIYTSTDVCRYRGWFDPADVEASTVVHFPDFVPDTASCDFTTVVALAVRLPLSTATTFTFRRANFVVAPASSPSLTPTPSVTPSLSVTSAASVSPSISVSPTTLVPSHVPHPVRVQVPVHNPVPVPVPNPAPAGTINVPIRGSPVPAPGIDVPVPTPVYVPVSVPTPVYVSVAVPFPLAVPVPVPIDIEGDSSSNSAQSVTSALGLIFVLASLFVVM